MERVGALIGTWKEARNICVNANRGYTYISENEVGYVEFPVKVSTIPIQSSSSSQPRLEILINASKDTAVKEPVHTPGRVIGAQDTLANLESSSSVERPLPQVIAIEKEGYVSGDDGKTADDGQIALAVSTNGSQTVCAPALDGHVLRKSANIAIAGDVATANGSTDVDETKTTGSEDCSVDERNIRMLQFMFH